MQPTYLTELRNQWFPNITHSGLSRLIDLLTKASPLLIHGHFTRCTAQGCLATHIAWNHPQTADLSTEAGITWLTQVARLNPATSEVITSWDRAGVYDWQMREELLAECVAEQQRRSSHRCIEAMNAVGI